MKKIMIAAAVLAAGSIQAQVKKPASMTTAKPAAGIFKNSVDSFSYAAGLSVAESMKGAGVEKLNSQLVARAMNDVFTNTTPLLTKAQADMTLQEKLQEYAKKKSDADKAPALAFLANNKKRAGVIALPNGLQYEIIKAGDANGLKPLAVDTVVVDYVGTLIDGTEFDNSVKRGEPATFPLNRVIRGWTEILQLMPKGSEWKVYIPGDLAYGENPPPGSPIKPNAVLVFDITLHDIKPATPAASK